MATQIIGGRINNVGAGEYQDEIGYRFVDTDIATINAGATWSTGSDWIDIRGTTDFQILCKFTGANASSAGNVTFNFICKGDGSTTTYTPTTASFTVVGALSGTSAIVKDGLISSRGGYGYIKLLSIVNGDATYALANVNAQIYWKTVRAY